MSTEVQTLKKYDGAEAPRLARTAPMASSDATSLTARSLLHLGCGGRSRLTHSKV